MPDNLLDGLKESPLKPVEVHENDPAVVAGVKEFLAAQEAAVSNETAEKRQVIEPDPVVGAESPDTALVKEALAPVNDIEVTEEEKTIYLKSLLTDELTRFSISLYGGRLKYELRTRSMYEQRRVLDIINDRIVNDEAVKNNLVKQFDMMQRYFALLMVERINGVLFSELHLEPGQTLEQHYQIMVAADAKAFSKMNNLCWTAMLTAMRQFESKCVKLAEHAVNEDFWKPRG